MGKGSHRYTGTTTYIVCGRAGRGGQDGPVLHEVGCLLLVEGTLILQPSSVTLNTLNLFTVEVGHCKREMISHETIKHDSNSARSTHLGWKRSNWWGQLDSSLSLPRIDPPSCESGT